MIVKMGFQNGKKYHYTLMLIAFVSTLLFIVFKAEVWFQAIPLVAFVPVLIHIKKVHKTIEPKRLDPELKKLALSTFLLAILFYIVLN